MIHRRRVLTAVAGGVTAALAGCLGDDDAPAEIHDETLTVTTTTSTYDTGLLDEVNAAFEDRYGVTVRAVAQGTGAALETGRRGDSDVVMVHARSLEDEFLREGYGINRRDLMFNDFVVVGPDDDPTGVDRMESVTDAFRAIAESESVFVSRGDDSGTHVKELAIWDAADADPEGEWYREAGSGMGEVLNQANRTPGYTLADRGTYVSQRSELDEVSIRVEGPIEGGSALLANPYGVVAVNPGVHETVNYDLAMSYIGFLTSREGREIIEEYAIDGEQLFFPEAVSEEPNFRQYVPENWTTEE
ncbi:tungstate transport system substrate-binding protein [Halorubrum alkaliphilum]|uniref:Tungstate transport system substrate-binding protein n=1 Tax=Halorubrum alkaliphilum TaxID=261290 RepID=A0A8T4GDU1_9EURY|nr:substrate-binding domain-containing protein [Halorubrum alkaliphilum]MBP1921907.1 tungstate transport system substrate-binding protein [Halorubrum alkaliphilum]